MKNRIKTNVEKKRVFFREWREFKGMSQEELAEKLETTPASISRLETGKQFYTQQSLEALALVYGCDESDLLEINPLAPEAPRLIVNNLKKASPELQRQILAVVEAMLKAG